MGSLERTSPLPPRASRRTAAIAAAVYLGLALWAMRAILPAPASTFATPARFQRSKMQPVIVSDQKLTAAMVTHNARTLVTRPWTFLDSGQCYPAPHSITLGEHMLGNGLLGVVPYALTGDPILTYNTVVTLTLWIPALAMYALVYFWTGSVSAAFVAGLLFGMHPGRIGDPAHPDVHGNQWTPLALLFAHGLFARQTWRDAAGLVLFVGLQVLESFYALLGLTIIGGTYGLYLVVRNVRRLPALAPKLLCTVVAIAGLAAAVLGPYLTTRATWGTLSGRVTLFYNMRDFGPGGGAYPGSVLVLLASVGLVDRLRGPRRRSDYDPRLVYLFAGLLVVWASVWEISIPRLGIHLPSLFLLAARVVPGLDAVRAGGAVGFGAVLVATFLAGYGVLALTERRGTIARRAITAALAAAALAEVFYAPLAAHSFGSSVDMNTYQVRPPASLLELYAKAGEGPVIDLPLTFGGGDFVAMADDVFLGAFHHQPVGACYNSFRLPIQAEIHAITKRLSKDSQASEALYALGFRTVVVNYLRRMGRWGGGYFELVPDPPRLAMVGTASLHAAYRLGSTTPIEASFAALAPATSPPGVAEAAPPPATFDLTFRNRSQATYRHPAPIVPTQLLVKWHDASGAVVDEHRVTTLLPLALAPGEETVRQIELPVPAAAGDYQVTAAPAATPEVVVAQLTVRVSPPAVPVAPTRARPVRGTR